MPSHKHFLCIDADADGRVLLVRTLMRVFPQSAVVEVQDYNTALSLLRTQSFDAIIAHRAIGADPDTLIRGLRDAAEGAPIVAVSSGDRAKEFLGAGATRFLRYDSWLLVGTTVAEILADNVSRQVQPEAVFSK